MARPEQQKGERQLGVADLPKLEETYDLRGGIYRRIRGFRDEIMEPWKREQRLNIHPQHLNSNRDQGLVRGLAETFIEHYQLAMREGGFLDLFEAWETIKGTVEARNIGNKERSRAGTVIENRERRKVFLENIKQLLPKVPLETENDEPVVSTFNPGIDQAIIRRLQQTVMRLGKKEKDPTFANIADDAITLSPKGIFLFNSNGGDAIYNQLIEWPEADVLGFSPIPIPALKWYNDIRRIVGGNLDPRTLFGLINVTIIRGQGSDRDVPTIIQALVPNPKKWVQAIENMRDVMQDFEKRFTGEPEAPLCYGHFMQHLQPMINDINGFNVLIRRAQFRFNEIERKIKMIEKAEERRKEKINAEAQMPGMRGLVGKFKKVFKS
jgi:hypothetical protein